MGRSERQRFIQAAQRSRNESARKLSQSGDFFSVDDAHVGCLIQSALLDDARATVHFNHGRDAEALNFWNRALALWPEPDLEGEISKTLATRSAGRAAGRLGKWREAATLFDAAHSFVDPNDRMELAAGLIADAALCWWEDGEKGKCLPRLIEAIRLAEKLPSGTDNLLAFRTRKIVGHAIMWLHNEIQGKSLEFLNKLPPGACSEQYAPKELKYLPDSNVQLLWLFLARFATSIDLSADFYDPYSSANDNIKDYGYPAFRDEYRIQLALRRGDLANLPELAWTYACTLNNQWQEKPDSPSPWPVDGLHGEAFRMSDSGTGAGLFVAGLISAAGNNVSILHTLSLWRHSAVDRPNFSTAQEWFAKAERIFSTSLPDSYAIVSSAGAAWWEILLHALRISIDPDATPLHLMHSHCSLLIRMTDTTWLEPCGPALLQLVESAWRRQILLVAALNTPRLTVPEILAACDARSYGALKAAAIVIAASPAVNCRLSTDVQQRLAAIQIGDFSRK